MMIDRNRGRLRAVSLLGLCGGMLECVILDWSRYASMSVRNGLYDGCHELSRRDGTRWPKRAERGLRRIRWLSILGALGTVNIGSLGILTMARTAVATLSTPPRSSSQSFAEWKA